MRNQLSKLEADMLLAGGKGRVPFAAVFGRHPCHLPKTADVQDCRHCSLLLILIRHAVRQRLKRHAIGLADFQIRARLLIVGPHLDRVPRPIASCLRHAASPVRIDCAASPTCSATCAAPPTC